MLVFSFIVLWKFKFREEVMIFTQNQLSIWARSNSTSDVCYSSSSEKQCSDLALVQQVILENRASLYCCTCIVEPSFLVYNITCKFSVDRFLFAPPPSLTPTYFACSSRQKNSCQEERALLSWGKSLLHMITCCHWIYMASNWRRFPGFLIQFDIFLQKSRWIC